MKSPLEMIEGPAAWRLSEGVMKNILTVPHSEIQKKVELQNARIDKVAGVGEASPPSTFHSRKGSGRRPEP